MPQIIDTPVSESVNPFTADVESLIGAGEGKSLTYDAADGIVDAKTADSLKIKFQRAANALDRTARAKVNKGDDGSFSVTFTLKPKQKTRTAPAADERAPEVAAAQDAIADAEPTADENTDAPKPRRK